MFKKSDGKKLRKSVRSLEMKVTELSQDKEILQEENEELRGIKAQIAIKTKEELKKEYEDEINGLCSDITNLKGKVDSYKEKQSKHQEEVQKVTLDANQKVHDLKLENQQLRHTAEMDGVDIESTEPYLKLLKDKEVLDEKVKMLAEQSGFYADNTKTIIGAMTGKPFVQELPKPLEPQTNPIPNGWRLDTNGDVYDEYCHFKGHRSNLNY